MFDNVKSAIANIATCVLPCFPPPVCFLVAGHVLNVLFLSAEAPRFPPTATPSTTPLSFGPYHQLI